MFVDIEDSTGISNYLEKSHYEDFLKDFHSTIKKVLKDKRWNVITHERNHKFMGDEFIAFFPHKENDSNILEDVLALASSIKFQWYFSKYNQIRIIKHDKEPIELNIGINTGDVSLMQYPILSGRSKKHTYEGFPITLAKRIQVVAKESQGSRITVTDRFYREYLKAFNIPNEFHYLGQKSLEGFAQRFSCYEWLGTSNYSFFSFDKIPNENIEKTLTSLYQKNPNNPWYANLLASYIFQLGEKVYYNSTTYNDNEHYRRCASFCINAIHNMPKYNLRTLHELLFVCLEVGDKWGELSFRTNQAYSADSTFSGALARRAKSLYMRGESLRKDNKVATAEQLINDAKEAAEELVELFNQSKDYESLFIAHFTLSRYYSQKNVLDEAGNHMKSAVVNAKNGDISWAYSEYKLYQKDFGMSEKLPDFKKEISKLEKLWSQFNT